MSPTTLVGLLLGLMFGAALVLLIAVLRGWTPTPTSRANRFTGMARAVTHPRLRWAVLAGVAVGVLTRWPVAVIAATALVWFWPLMFGAGKLTAHQIERLEALATWTENLRDSIAGSIGLEDAIRHSVGVAPETMRAPLQRLDGRMRAQIPLRSALAELAAEFDDAAADMVVAALILNANLRGRELASTLGSLAAAAREEVDMRRKVDVDSRKLRQEAIIIAAFTVVFGGVIAVFSREFMSPYATVFGQMVLALVMAVMATGLMLVRRAAMIEPPARFLASDTQLERALSRGGRR
ncbi:MAG: type II secretion system protein [Actinomycetales bacterium]|nr:type II secretion system protein [Actinomycetales bacterium]